jgi:hypothetical protein
LLRAIGLIQDYPVLTHQAFGTFLFADAVFGVAIAAIDSLVIARLKWHSCRFAASSTGYWSGFTMWIVLYTSLGFLGVLGLFHLTAGWATPGRIRETLRSMEFLLFNRKSEILPAVNAVE